MTRDLSLDSQKSYIHHNSLHQLDLCFQTPVVQIAICHIIKL
jgi:hypothetical protein